MTDNICVLLGIFAESLWEGNTTTCLVTSGLPDQKYFSPIQLSFIVLQNHIRDRDILSFIRAADPRLNCPTTEQSRHRK